MSHGVFGPERPMSVRTYAPWELFDLHARAIEPLGPSDLQQDLHTGTGQGTCVWVSKAMLQTGWNKQEGRWQTGFWCAFGAAACFSTKVSQRVRRRPVGSDRGRSGSCWIHAEGNSAFCVSKWKHNHTPQVSLGQSWLLLVQANAFARRSWCVWPKGSRTVNWRRQIWGRSLVVRGCHLVLDLWLLVEAAFDLVI